MAKVPHQCGTQTHHIWFLIKQPTAYATIQLVPESFDLQAGESEEKSLKKVSRWRFFF